MDFLFISTNDWVPFGGSEVLWYKSAISLSNQGRKVSFLAKRWDPMPRHYAELDTNGCKVFYRQERSNNTLGRIKKMLSVRFPIFKDSNIDLQDCWKKQIESINPKLMIISMGDQNQGSPWVDIATYLGIPYILIVQLFVPDALPSNNLIASFHEKYNNALVTFTVSNQNRAQILSISNIDATKIRTVFNPFDLYPRSIQFPKIDGCFNLAMIASLNANHKKQDLLIEVLSMDKWKERDILVNLYGDGANRKALNLLAEKANLRNLTFKGYETDHALIWQRNHAFILTSKMEGMSLALLEAISYQRIPIVTNVGGAKEIIDDNETGFIAKHINTESIDEALERAWIKRFEGEEMGKRGYEKLIKIVKRDPVDDFCSKLIDLYTKLG